MLIGPTIFELRRQVLLLVAFDSTLSKLADSELCQRYQPHLLLVEDRVVMQQCRIVMHPF